MPTTAATLPSAGVASPSVPAASTHPGILPGTREYRNTILALFLVGFASFSLIYCVQPLLPEFARDFRVSPAQSSLALSLTTGLLALSIFAAGAYSQGVSRRALMCTSTLLGAACNIAAALAPNWHTMLAARALEGVVLGGVPAVAMAYLGEEMAPGHLGKAMGFYVAGTALGAMMGRVGMGLLTEFDSWRGAMGILGALGLLATAGFVWLLPPSRHFTPKPGFDLSFHLAAWGQHLRNPKLLRLFGGGFTLTSVFVTLFNYASFRLSQPPYGLGQTACAMIFLTYAFGVFSSSAAGSLADKMGRRPVILMGFLLMLAGLALTLFSSLFILITGIALVTAGYFIAHSVVSGSIGPLAGLTKGHASSLYLLFYYMGSSITGSVGGWFWQHGGWPGVCALTGAMGLLGLVLTRVRTED